MILKKHEQINKKFSKRKILQFPYLNFRRKKNLTSHKNPPIDGMSQEINRQSSWNN